MLAHQAFSIITFQIDQLWVCLRSPEAADPQRGALTAAANIWSLAATLLHIFTGSPPFKGLTTKHVMTFLQSDDQLPLVPASLPAPLQTVLKSCFADFMKRPQADEIVVVLKVSHHLFNLGDIVPTATCHVHVADVANDWPLTQ